MKKQLFTGMVVGAGLLLTAGCSPADMVGAVTGEVEEEKVNVAKDDAERLEVELELGAGEMVVAGGADQWLTGTITHGQGMEPEVTYEQEGAAGEITVEQEKNFLGNINVGDEENEWNLELADDIPMNLEVNAGASKTDLDLRGVRLTGLAVDAGVGSIMIDLSGDWEESFKVDLDTGVGKTAVILPEDVGVKVISEAGVGETDFEGLTSQGEGVYVNEAYETADVIITVEADLGVGKAVFKTE